jgi:hypothetical protein
MPDLGADYCYGMPEALNRRAAKSLDKSKVPAGILSRPAKAPAETLSRPAAEGRFAPLSRPAIEGFRSAGINKQDHTPTEE